MRHLNVIVILADDLGFGDLGAFGNRFLQTPRLDRLAGEGVRLTHHYSASPICTPARAALLTGRYNHRTGALDVPSNRGLDRIALTERTIADLFRTAGYRTGMVGKWHNGAHDMRYHPNARGFDEFTGFLNGGMDYWAWVLDRNGEPRPSDGRYLTDVFAEDAVGFIRRHRERPFFLYVAFNAPHAPLQAPEEDVEPFLGSGEVNGAVATLYGMIRRMDTGIGRIVDCLDDEGLANDTLVLFTSDNGPWMGNQRFRDSTCSMNRFNGPYSGMKLDTLEGGIRVPAILRWPGRLPADATCEDPVHFTDWLPTLLSLAGVEPRTPNPLDGMDLSRTLLSGEHVPDRTLFWQWNRYQPVARCNAAMRDGSWKLYWPPIPEAIRKDPADNEPYVRGLRHAHEIRAIESPFLDRVLSEPRPPKLFDLNADPAEKADLAGRFPERVEAMAAQWHEWFGGLHVDRTQTQ